MLGPGPYRSRAVDVPGVAGREHLVGGPVEVGSLWPGNHNTYGFQRQKFRRTNWYRKIPRAFPQGFLGPIPPGWRGLEATLCPSLCGGSAYRAISCHLSIGVPWGNISLLPPFYRPSIGDTASQPLRLPLESGFLPWLQHGGWAPSACSCASADTISSNRLGCVQTQSVGWMRGTFSFAQSGTVGYFSIWKLCLCSSLRVSWHPALGCTKMAPPTEGLGNWDSVLEKIRVCECLCTPLPSAGWNQSSSAVCHSPYINNSEWRVSFSLGAQVCAFKEEGPGILSLQTTTINFLVGLWDAAKAPCTGRFLGPKSYHRSLASLGKTGDSEL